MSLYLGEVLLDNVAGAPCLYKYCPSSSPDAKTRPLVVFVPGGAHLARISYGGHDGYRSEDFLSHWVNEQGFNFVGISYPLETEAQVMPADHAGFRINAWGHQAAEVTKAVIAQNDLSPTVILASWSMGGKIVVPYSKAAKDLGVDLDFYVALAATPGLQALPGGNPGRANIHRTTNGYATSPPLLKIFLAQLEHQNKLNATSVPIIPEDVFTRDYFGHTPISMLGWGLKHADGDFVDDEGLSVQDAAASEFAFFPWISTLYPSSELDMRHALADKATWQFIFTLMLTGEVEAARRAGTQLTGEKWQSVAALVDSIPNKLSTRVTGSHHFFVGEEGARTTAKLITDYWQSHKALKIELEELLAK